MKTRKLTPKQTIHAYCHYCVQDRSDDGVENCSGDLVFATGRSCPFYLHRFGQRRPPIKIFRKFCQECMGGNKHLVKECSTMDCLVHPFRMGKNPQMKGASSVQMNKIRRPGTTFSATIIAQDE